jgi:hypothetical protein
MAWLPIPFDVEFLDSDGLPITGAAPTITIRNSSGTAVITGAAMTEYVSETGAAYYYDYTPLAAGTYRGSASTADPDASRSVILIGNATAVEESSGATPAEIADAVWDRNPRTLTGPTLTFQSPFWPDTETLTLIRSDSYTTGDDNRPLQWHSDAYPVLTGASIALLMRSIGAPTDVLSFSGTVIDASTAQVELTSAQTAAFDTSSNGNQPTYQYAVVATLADSTVVTLARGSIIVRRLPTNL